MGAGRGPGRRLALAALALTALLPVLAGCTTPDGSSPPEPIPDLVVDRLTSTADGRIRREVDQVRVPDDGRPVGDAATTTLPAGDAGSLRLVVRPDERRQTIDGFGASLTDASATLLAGLPPAERERALRNLFDPEGDAGLHVVRLVIGPSDFSPVHATYDDTATPDPGLLRFSIDHDREAIIPMAQAIRRIDPDVQFVASPWSPPAWMKSGNKLTSGSLRPEYEDALADYFVRYLTAYRDAGIDIPYVTVQNEPEFAPYTYPGMRMSPAQQVRFIRSSLAPALRRAGLATKVLVYDHNWDDPRYAVSVLGAEGVQPTAVGAAFHCYSGRARWAQEPVHETFGYPAKIWMTECSGGDWQGDRANAFRLMSGFVLDTIRWWGNAAIFWNLALDPDRGPRYGGCSNCRGVIEVDGARWTPGPDQDVLAAFGRWMRPGSVRVEAEAQGRRAARRGVKVVAARTGNEHLVLVVGNDGPARSALVVAGDRRFRVDLRADSLTTLRWRA